MLVGDPGGKSRFVHRLGEVLGLVIIFPKPAANHLDALLPAVLADLACERGLDARWVAPLAGAEHTAFAAHWRDGSIRRLRRLVEAILRERDRTAARN